MTDMREALEKAREYIDREPSRQNCAEAIWLIEQIDKALSAPQPEPSGDEVERVIIAWCDFTKEDFEELKKSENPGLVYAYSEYRKNAKAAIAAMDARREVVDLEPMAVDLDAAISRIEEIQDAGCGAFTTRSIAEICAAAWGLKTKEKKQ